MNEDTTFLIVEDDDASRELIVKSLEAYGISNYVAPASKEECERAMVSGNFRAAVVDYNLDAWVGKQGVSPLLIGDIECTDGMDLAVALSNENSRLPIKLVSSAAAKLKQVFVTRTVPNNVQQLVKSGFEKDDEPYYDYIPRYLRDFFQFEISSNALFDASAIIPVEAALYYCKKILFTQESGHFIWKVGDFAWQAYVDEKPAAPWPLLEDNSPLRQDKFIVKISPEDFDLDEIYCLSDPWSCTRRDADQSGLHFRFRGKDQLFHLLTELAQLKFILRLYQNGERSGSRVLQDLKKLSYTSQLEAQKWLFKKGTIPEENTLMDLKKIIDQDDEASLPRVLNMYKGAVEEIEDGVATVQFQNLSREGGVRIESFPLDEITQFGLEKDALFYYTIYRPSSGSQAFQIEPL